MKRARAPRRQGEPEPSAAPLSVAEEAGFPRLLPGLATFGGGLALVLAFRALYLARFGHDPCWMNLNFLLEAKAVRFGYAAEFSGMPLVRGILVLARSAGASAPLSLGVVYLVGHALLASGVFVLAKTVLGPSARSRAAVALAVAVLPAFSTDAGYRNASCTLAAGLFAALAALLVPGSPIRPGLARSSGAFLLAAAAATCRPESALAAGGLAAALAVGGRRLGCGRRGAAIATAGLALGLALSATWNQQAPDRGLSAGTWAFYTFYEASPFLLRIGALLRDPATVGTEYARYVQTARLFGGFEENGGSILRALWRHPGDAALWLSAKPFDLLVTILAPDSFTPLGAAVFFLWARRLRREGWRSSARRWAPALCAFGAPLAFLVFWSQGHAPYLLIASPLLLLMALWGLEPWIVAAAPVRLRWAAWGVAATGALAVAAAGHGSPSSAPAFEEAARWLEERCAAGGCLVNALPQALDAEAWADLQAGARFPRKDKRAEAFVLRRYPPSYLDGVRLERRIEEARRHGWRGPVLYVRARATSLEAFHDDFDPEHRLEGEPDLAGAAPAATFRRGADLVEVFELGP